MMEYSLLYSIFLLCYDIFSAELIVTRDYDDDGVVVSRSHCRRRCNRRRCCCYDICFKNDLKKYIFFWIF